MALTDSAGVASDTYDIDARNGRACTSVATTPSTTSSPDPPHDDSGQDLARAAARMAARPAIDARHAHGTLIGDGGIQYNYIFLDDGPATSLPNESSPSQSRTRRFLARLWKISVETATILAVVPLFFSLSSDDVPQGRSDISQAGDSTGPVGLGGPRNCDGPAQTPEPVKPADAIVLSEYAENAEWRSGSGKVTFGNIRDPIGEVSKRPRDPLETLKCYSVLLTHPNWSNNGFIRGCFNLPRPIRVDDRFRTEVGFSGGATRGDARFQVYVRDGQGKETRIVDLVDQYDGTLRPIDEPLTGFAAAKVICILVNAHGSSGDDWAIWVEPRIEPVR